MYCAAKASKCTQCTIHCDINEKLAYQWNTERLNFDERYSKEVFDGLLQRFEFPDSRNRWDSPLFTIQVDDVIHFQDIYECLINKAPPKPNMSTQPVSVPDLNFLL